jgi:lipoyl-dependent peroxiredoxin
MTTKSSEAQWQGGLKDGKGTMSLGSGSYEGNYTFASRFETGKGTNPEELIAAAHAGCFSMALSAALGEAQKTPTRIHTKADVHLNFVNGAPTINKIDLTTEAEVPGLDDATFQKIAAGAKANCPVSKVLAGAEISLKATLL